MKKRFLLVAAMVVTISVTTVIVVAQQERKRDSNRKVKPFDAPANAMNSQRASSFSNNSVAGFGDRQDPSNRTMHPNQLPSFPNSSHSHHGSPQASGFTANVHSPAEQKKVRELRDLRNRFASLATQIAGTMEKSELETGIAEMEKRLSEEQAQRDLVSVHGHLQSIIDNFPESSAAKQARKMLKAIEQTKEESASESVSIE